MEKELDRRHSRQEFFTEQEVWLVLENVVSACTFFEQHKIYHGDIRPINILLTNEGIIKIADNGIVQSDKNGYLKSLTTGEQTYLSPQLLSSLARRDTKPSHNVVKSDVFALGITLL